MTLLDRYIKGDTIEVYEEIYALGQGAFNEDVSQQVHSVLNETFERVAFNLNVIFEELKSVNYKFASISMYRENPLLPPPSETDNLLIKIKSRIKDGGHLPLSLEYFYKIVGSCNFCWDWETYPEIPWEGADPIDTFSLKDLLEAVYENYDREDILIAGDYLQKDNVSGSSYNIELTPTPSVDSLLLHENWNVPFIEYLRITLNNCGFSMADECDYESLKAFCNTVRPQMQKV